MEVPMSAPGQPENKEQEEPSVEPLPAPVDMETENSPAGELENSPPTDGSKSPVIIYSPPSITKCCNDSLDIIMIESEESLPMITENKENVEPKIDKNDQTEIIKSLKKIISNLKIKNLRDVSIAKKNTRRDVVDKMSANHKLSLVKERKNHLKLLRETRELYENRLSDVEKFYVEKIAVLEGNRTIAFDALLETKSTLEDQIKKSTSNLDDIINVISSYPSYSASSVRSLPLVKNTEKRSFSRIFDENSDKITQMETEVYEQKLRITCLENKIKDEITSKGQIQQKLAYTELLYRTTIREKDELIKKLQDDLSDLKNSKNEMEARHKDQFLKYDRMLKRSQAEIAVQKREVLALRTQFVPGTPTNFNANKHKQTPSMIKESTPSSSKLSSNVTLHDASGANKVRLFNDRTPSFCTAASGQSSPSGAVSQTQTPSSHASKSLRSTKAPSSYASKSLRSTKAPSENSSNGSSAASEDSEKSKPKSTRVLRNRRKRAIKSRKVL